MKIERHVTLLMVAVEGDDAQAVLEAYNRGLELARDATVAGVGIDRNRTINGVKTRVCVKLEDNS